LVQTRSFLDIITHLNSLIAACRKRDVRAVKQLLNQGVKDNLTNTFGDKTSLTRTVSWCHVVVVSAMDAAGADVHYGHGTGRTSLALACQGGSLAMVRTLCDVGTVQTTVVAIW